MPQATHILPSSPYHNLSAGDLVDRLGAVKTEIGTLERVRKRCETN
jgi:hypothetical protein